MASGYHYNFQSILISETTLSYFDWCLNLMLENAADLTFNEQWSEQNLNNFRSPSTFYVYGLLSYENVLTQGSMTARDNIWKKLKWKYFLNRELTTEHTNWMYYVYFQYWLRKWNSLEIHLHLIKLIFSPSHNYWQVGIFEKYERTFFLLFIAIIFKLIQPHSWE